MQDIGNPHRGECTEPGAADHAITERACLCGRCGIAGRGLARRRFSCPHPRVFQSITTIYLRRPTSLSHQRASPNPAGWSRALVSARRFSTNKETSCCCTSRFSRSIPITSVAVFRIFLRRSSWERSCLDCHCHVGQSSMSRKDHDTTASSRGSLRQIAHVKIPKILRLGIVITNDGVEKNSRRASVVESEP